MPNTEINALPRRFGSRAVSALAAILIAAPCAILLPGCSDSEEPDTQTTAPAPDESESIRTDQYVVRGEVVRLPSAAEPAAEFMVRHEAIPHYRASGSKLGMNTMTMPFPVGPDLSLEGVQVGDKIELTFEVRFDTEKDRPIAYHATEVLKLPPETVLDFSPLPKSTPAAP